MAKHRRHHDISVPQPSRTDLDSRTEYVQITYQAPLPPPHMLEQYERILPGTSDRLISQMENQSAHRQRLETSTINANIQNERRGQLFAFILATIAILGAFFLIATGRDRYGIYIFITTFASLVSVFIIGKVSQNRELTQKRKEMKQFLGVPSQPDPHD
jgi:uncharacterized membrane protein